MSPTDVLQAGLALADLGLSVARGERTSPVEVVRGIFAIAVKLLPVDDLKKHLDDAAVRRDELAADLAEEAKFGAK